MPLVFSFLHDSSLILSRAFLSFVQWPEWEMRTKMAENELTFVDAQMVLEQHTEAYEHLLRALKSEPVALAGCLYKVRDLTTQRSYGVVGFVVVCCIVHFSAMMLCRLSEFLQTYWRPPISSHIHGICKNM